MGRSPTYPASLWLPVVMLALLSVANSSAQTMYKYKGENGLWIYTDRKPAEDENFEVRELESTFVAPEFSVTHEVLGTTMEFVAHNDFYAPIEVHLEFHSRAAR